jgi:hypothetical protein
LPPAVAAPAPPPAAEDDVTGLMANVDRILAEKRASDTAIAASPAPVVIPPPAMATDPLAPSTEPVPLVGLMGGALPAALPAGSRRAPALIENPSGLPVPPADIPNPSP